MTEDEIISWLRAIDKNMLKFADLMEIMTVRLIQLEHEIKVLKEDVEIARL